MSASELIHYFSSHPATFGFQAALPPDNITLNPANNRTDQSLSDFQTGFGAAAHATLDTQQLISYTRVALIDAVASIQGSDGDVIALKKCKNYFMTFWTMLCLIGLLIQLLF